MDKNDILKICQSAGYTDDTRSVTCKSLSDSCLTVFRVAKIPTLKMLKVVIISDLRVAPKKRRLKG